MTEIEEFTKVVEHVNEGQWIPFGIMGASLGVIILLFIYILKLKEKNFNIRHDKTDKTTEKLTEISVGMKTMLAVHEMEIKTLKSVS